MNVTIEGEIARIDHWLGANDCSQNAESDSESESIESTTINGDQDSQTNAWAFDSNEVGDHRTDDASEAGLDKTSPVSWGQKSACLL